MAKQKRNEYDYGECEICDTPMVENVPAGVCPQCGGKVVTTEVGRRIARLLENSEKVANAPRISVPAINWDAEAEAAIA